MNVLWSALKKEKSRFKEEILELFIAILNIKKNK